MDISSDALIVERLGDEAIVFDPATDEVHHLNARALATFAAATDDVSRRNLIRGGLLVGAGAAATTLLAPTAASALSKPGVSGPLATGIDFATQFAAFIAGSPATSATNTTNFFPGLDTSDPILPTGNTYTKVTAPTGVTATDSGGGSGPTNSATQYFYAVTAIDVLGNESLPGTATGYTQSAGHVVTIGWTAVLHAATYRVYRKLGSGGTYGIVTTVMAPTVTASDASTTTTVGIPPAAAPAGGIFDNGGLSPAVGFPNTATTVTFLSASNTRFCLGFTIPATYLGAPIQTGTGLTLKLVITATFTGTLVATFAKNGAASGTAAASGSITSATTSTVTSPVFTPVATGDSYFVVLTKTLAGSATGTLNLTAS